MMPGRFDLVKVTDSYGVNYDVYPGGETTCAVHNGPINIQWKITNLGAEVTCWCRAIRSDTGELIGYSTVYLATNESSSAIFPYNFDTPSGVPIQIFCGEGAETWQTLNFNLSTIGMVSMVSISVSGSGSSNPVAGTYEYPLGSNLTVSATASSGWKFVKMTRTSAGSVSETTDNPATFTNLLVSEAINVVFETLEPGPGPGAGGIPWYIPLGVGLMVAVGLIYAITRK
jgi:hypothetical protein